MSTLDQAADKLIAQALQIKAERDRALKLLREVLGYSTLGAQGDFKIRVREFLQGIDQ